jgi:hypothetical protein
MNAAAREHYNHLFPADSPMEYMWTSLPVDEAGNRHLPTTEKPATGRWDGVRAFLNALAVSDYAEVCLSTAAKEEQESVRAEWRELQRRKEFITGFFAHPYVWMRAPIYGVQKLKPHDAARLYLMVEPRERGDFVCYGTEEQAVCPATEP